MRRKLSLLVRVAPAALLAMTISLPLHSAQTTSTAYQCTVNASAGTTDCGSPIIVSGSGSQRAATIDLSGGYVRLDAFVDVCSPTGYWIHFGDSPSDNGGGGDAAQTDHDAETYINGTTFYTYGTYDYAHGVIDPIVTTPNVIPASGCRTVQYTIRENRIDFDNDGDPSDPSSQVVQSLSTFEVAPYDEPDGEDPNGVYANTWYAGINRTAGDASRTGTGTSKVCFVLSKTDSPSPSTLTSLCSPPPTPQPPVACGWTSTASGTAPLGVWFYGTCSYDPDGGTITNYQWDTGEGIDWGSTTYHTYYYPGSYPVWLTVWDDEGQSSSTFLGYIYVN